MGTHRRRQRRLVEPRRVADNRRAAIQRAKNGQKKRKEK